MRKLFCESCEQNYLQITNIVISRLPEKYQEVFFDDYSLLNTNAQNVYFMSNFTVKSTKCGKNLWSVYESKMALF